MPYTKTQWVNKQTRLNATNLNHLEGQYDDAVAELGRVPELAAFHKALGVRSAAEPATILCVGDSWIEGSGDTIQLGQRMVDKLAAALGERFAPNRPVGAYLPSQWGAPGSTMQSPPAALSKNLPVENTWGLGRRNSVMSDPSTITWTLTARYARLFYLQFPEQGTFDILVDAAKVRTVDTAGVANVGAYVDLDMGTDAQHTLTVSQLTGGVRPFGVQFWSSTTRLHVLDGGHAGSFTHEFAGAAAANHWFAASKTDPDLVVICTGLNTFYQLGIDNFAADFAQVVSDAQSAAPSASVLVVVAATPNNADSGAGGHTWDQFATIQRTVATVAGVGFLDLRSRVAPFTDDPDELWQQEGVHLNRYGQALAADIITSYITPRA